MKPWPIITEENEVRIDLPEFYDTYFGDVDTMTPEEWRIVHMISVTPMMLAACEACSALFAAESEFPDSDAEDYPPMRMLKTRTRAVQLVQSVLAQAEEAK